MALPGHFLFILLLTSFMKAFRVSCVHHRNALYRLRKTLTSGLGLDDMSLAWPAVVHYWFSFTLAYSRISYEYSSLFIIVINLIFMFSL